MIRRTLSYVLLVAALVVCLAQPAGAGAGQDGGGGSSSTAVRRLPRTAAEADQRDDGNTQGAPWVIGSAVVAGAVILVGGLWMKRRMEREG